MGFRHHRTALSRRPWRFVADCRQRATARVREWKREQYGRSDIGLRHRRFLSWQELDGAPEYRAAVALVQQFAENLGSVLLLIGKRGSGKTQLACVAVRETIDRRRSARYVCCIDLLCDLRGRYGDSGGHYADLEWLEEWAAPYLLVVDEATERVDGPTGHGLIMLSALVDRRYRNLRPTILIANVAREQIVAALGASIADRANEEGGVLDFGAWPSFR